MEIINKEKLNEPKDAIDAEFIKHQEIFEQGRLHSQPSPITLELINKMNDKLNSLENTTVKIETKLDNVTDLLKNHIVEETVYRNKQDNFHKEIYEQKADKKEVEAIKLGYDSKASQKDVDSIQSNLNRVVWIVISTVLLAVLDIVLRK